MVPDQTTHHLLLPQSRRDGSGPLVEWSITRVQDADGQLQCHVCIGRDFSQAQRLEDGLRRNDKLRAVVTLAAGVAHDFNNLLGSIMGLAEVCTAQAEPGAQLARNLGNILLTGSRAAGLVAQLQSFARDTPLVLRPVALQALLQHVPPLLAAGLPMGVGLQLELLAGPDVQVKADTAQVEQVLLNLVKNAGYAMRHCGGTVRLLADLAPLDANTPAVRLRVIDQGEGIPPELLPRSFEPFSPPNRWTKAPAWAWPPHSASSATPAAGCRPAARRAWRRCSRRCCRWRCRLSA